MNTSKLYLMQQSYIENLEDNLNVTEFLNGLSLGIGVNIKEVYSLLEDPIFLKVMEKKLKNMSRLAIDTTHKEQYDKLAVACKKRRKKAIDKTTTSEFVNQLIAIHFFRD